VDTPTQRLMTSLRGTATSRGRPVWATVAAVVLAAIIAGVIVENSGNTPPAAARARVYRNLDTCLLTDPHGITSGPGLQAWQGLQAYSHLTAVRVSYVQVAGPDTAATARQFLNGLLQRHCQLIVTVGNSQNAAAEEASPTTPNTRFLIIGTPTHLLPNVTAIGPNTANLNNAITQSLTRMMKA
jgi:basic membrane lipoprotein Med (substrate-binding protein (PBP1-ABC) superfamily)